MAQNRVANRQLQGLPSVNVTVGAIPSPFVSWLMDYSNQPAGAATPAATGTAYTDFTWSGATPGSFLVPGCCEQGLRYQDSDFVVWGENTIDVTLVIAATTLFMVATVVFQDNALNGFNFSTTHISSGVSRMEVHKVVDGIGTPVAIGTNFSYVNGTPKTLRWHDDGTNLRFYVDAVLIDTLPSVLPHGGMNRLRDMYVADSNGERVYSVTILGS